jgi:phosphatidylinositol kinase/protein kinase (PI-3  family)
MQESTGEDLDLVDFYQMKFGKQYKEAVNNLADSLAAYSLVCYIL